MTVEKRCCISLDEINGFQFECKKCGVKTVFPVRNQVAMPGRCTHCDYEWLAPTPQTMGTIGVALQNFLAAVRIIIERAPEIGVVFTMEIKEAVRDCN